MDLVANRSVVELELRHALGSRRTNQRNSVLLLRAAPHWQGEPEFSFDEKGRQVSVRVAACGTVLSVLDALADARPGGQYLVVLTSCDARDVGDSVLAAAMQPEIKPVDRWDLVKDSFGALRIDPALTKQDSRWIAEALLDAQPAGGWRRLSGTVLGRATALNRLAATRLGIEDADDSPVDPAALLQWTTKRASVDTFLRLNETERAGLIAWLGETTGGVADVVFAMAPAGLVPDAVPFGLAAAALYGPPVHAQSADTEPDETVGEVVVARVRAEERYLGGKAPDIAKVRAFGEAAESLVTRWADNGHASQAATACQQAEVILRGLAGTDEGDRALASRSKVLRPYGASTGRARRSSRGGWRSGRSGAAWPPPRCRSPRPRRRCTSWRPFTGGLSSSFLPPPTRRARCVRSSTRGFTRSKKTCLPRGRSAQRTPIGWQRTSIR